jgi:hypothetical protein
MSLRTLFSFAVLSAALAGQQLVLPDHHHLTESPTQSGDSGSPNFWRTGGGRFQILYAASHFTGKAGVSEGITIDKLLFRGEGGEPNLGTQSWAGVAVRLGWTTLASLSPTFATNQAPVFPDLTTMGPVSTHTVTVLPSSGGSPNDYNIVIDLFAAIASFPYDPTGAQPNLLIDITLPNAAVVPPNIGPVMQMQDTTGNIATIGGHAVTSGAWNGAVGTLTNPLVVGIEFTGDGGFAPPIPSRNEYYGAACGGATQSFYQSFLPGQPFDLAGCGLELRPDVPPPAVPSYYTVSKIATSAINYGGLNFTADSGLDDGLVLANLGFNLKYPGGPAAGTPAIKACTNGFVWLDPAMNGNAWDPAVNQLLGVAPGNAARLAPLWADLHCGRNTPTWGATAGMHVRTFGPPTLQTCCITWFRVGAFNSVNAPGHAEYDFQCQIHEATGIIEFHYGGGSLSPAFGPSSSALAALVGFSPGNRNLGGSKDPQSRDLSHEIPFLTSALDVANNMAIAAVSTGGGGAIHGGRMIGGDTVRWDVTDVPANASVGVMLLDIVGSKPGWDLPPFTAPGCIISTGYAPVAWAVGISGTTMIDVGSLFIPHGHEGLKIHAQFVAFDPSLGQITAATNAIEHTVGLR